MADKRITELNTHTSPQLSDLIAIVNSNETKKIAYGTLYYGIRDGLVSGSSQIDITQTQNYGDVMITGSLSDTTITFTKGDSSTFNIDLGDTFVTPSQTGSLVESAYISLYSTSSQQLVASGSEQVVTFTDIWAQDGISLVDNSKITMAKAGVYRFTFTAQVTNAANAVYDSFFWVKYNGNNFPNSATQMTLDPRKSSGEASAQLMTMNIVGVAQNDNDYIQLYWTGEDTQTVIKETPQNGVVPETPSIIANVVRIG